MKRFRLQMAESKKGKNAHTRWIQHLMCFHSIVSGLTSEVNAYLGKNVIHHAGVESQCFHCLSPAPKQDTKSLGTSYPKESCPDPALRKQRRWWQASVPWNGYSERCHLSTKDMKMQWTQLKCGILHWNSSLAGMSQQNPSSRTYLNYFYKGVFSPH